ncbi:hypothetical protein [Actinomadura parmotrematis]|uniref:Tetratricopeptide repeat protein n=1 Tax=Actinomadura parmotrematis TaxID=2864039 RepID=A0ABS7G008_9ACTN|nr:hypothetical protein [Actinomadura parmotrematis]MBW8485725.1 hypothetical protein [Actinomadura parmotrematis]
MTSETTYSPVAALVHAGRWDAALPLAGSIGERAAILVDAHWWRLSGRAEAEEAVAALAAEDPVVAGYHAAVLAYTRVLFGPEPDAGDAARAREGFAAAEAHPVLAPWAVFWQGVVADNLDGDAAAPALFSRALDAALATGDPLLESYAVRHLGGPAAERGDPAGVAMLRRSYDLRASLGARPQTAAAAVYLAACLPEGEEAERLRTLAAATARELGLTWLAAAG